MLDFGLNVPGPLKVKVVQLSSPTIPMITSRPTYAADLVTSPDETCPGSSDDPQAAPGWLCLYVGSVANVGEFAIPRLGSDATGYLGIDFRVKATDATTTYAYVRYAVTAPND